MHSLYGPNTSSRRHFVAPSSFVRCFFLRVFLTFIPLFLVTAAGTAHAVSLSGTSAIQLSPGVADYTAEGDIDWINWGERNSALVNRKASGGSQLSDVTIVGGTARRFGGTSAVWTTATWSDGSPLANEPGFPGGLLMSQLGASYEFTAPADGGAKELRVYLGVSGNAEGTLEASLSDGSAAPFSTVLPSSGAIRSYIVTLNYESTTPGATLLVKFTRTGGGNSNNIRLQGATLAGSNGTTNAPPSLDPIGNQTISESNTLAFTATATDPTGPAPIAMTIAQSTPSLPAAASYFDNGDGTADFAWTPTPADVGTYSVTFRATEDSGNGLFAEQTITVNVTAGSGSGSNQLSGTSAIQLSPGVVDYTAEGDIDWINWGERNSALVNRKASGGSQISDVTIVGGTSRRFGGSSAVWTTATWSDGSPLANEPGFPGGLLMSQLGASYEFTAPADGGAKELRVYLGVSGNAEGTLEASLSDGSAAPFTTVLPATNAIRSYIVTLNYESTTPGATLLVKFTRTGGGNSNNIRLQGATLAGSTGTTNAPPSLNTIGNQTIADSNTLAFTATATDPTGPAPIAMTIAQSTPSLPAAASYFDNGDGTADFAWTPTPADVGTYNVTFRATEDGGNGLFSEEIATITVTAANINNAPTIDPIGNQSVTQPNTLSFGVNANDPDGPAPLVLSLDNSVPALPAAATFVDNGDGTGDFSWTPSAADVGTYQVTFQATEDNGNGQFAQQTITLSVASGSGSAQLSGTSAIQLSPGVVNYTLQGDLDWINLGERNSAPLNRKATGGSQLSDVTINGGTTQRFGGSSAVWTTATWSDGTPIANETGFPGGLRMNQLGASFEFTAAADGGPKTLRIYLGVSGNAEGTLEASLSDGSAAPFTTVLPATNAIRSYIVTINFESTTPGATLLVEFTRTGGGATNNIRLQGATLAAQLPPISLPVTDDFSDNNFDGWATFDDTPDSSSWSVVAGELIQANLVQSAFAEFEGFQIGTNAVLLNGSTLSDYEYSVTAEFLADSFQESIGVLFRYQDPQNYYRLTISGRNGFSRLEKRVAGVFTPLATNARGYTVGEILDVTVRADGSNLVTEVNGDEIFAVTDSDLPTGSVGLFSRDNSRFDDVNLVELDNLADVTLATPVAHTTEAGVDINATALVRNAPPGADVQFVLNGGATQTDTSAPYTATFSNLAQGNYSIEAILLNNAGNQLDSDTNDLVGRGGSLTVAIGDSITNGVGDNFASDDVTNLQRVISTQGYPSLLTDLLNDNSPSGTTVVVSEGVPGDQSFDAAFSRIDGVRQRHQAMDRAFIMLGTNDALANIPSGDGCTTNCAGTYKGNMQTLIDKIRFDDYPANTQPTGTSVIVAETIAAFDSAQPFNSVTNNRIRVFNEIIRDQLNGITVGPDLFNFFLPNANTSNGSLLNDTLHPNGLGYRLIATLWHNSVSIPAAALPIPFYLTDIATSGSAAPKQDLIEIDDQVYLDSPTLVTAFPSDLEDGRWLRTNDSDASNTSANYLSFDVDRSVEVYVAVDGGATNNPAWLSTFTATGQTVSSDSATTPSYDVYVRTYAPGTIVLGGASRAPAANVDANMLVIVVEI